MSVQNLMTIRIVHRICKSQFSVQNQICGQQFEVRIQNNNGIE